MTTSEISRLLAIGDGDAALLYMQIKTNSTPILTGKRMQDAKEKLCSGGLLEQKKTAPKIDIAKTINSDASFRQLTLDTEKRFGKTTAPQNLETLCTIYKKLGYLVTLSLLDYCIEEHQRIYSRLPSFKWIEKEALLWQNNGILTSEAADEYILQKYSQRQDKTKIFKSVGIFNRTPSVTEKKYVDEWLSLGFPPETIAIAYDITVTNTGKMAWKYCDTILKSWHNKNLHTPEEIENGKDKKSDEDDDNIDEVISRNQKVLKMISGNL